MTAIAQWFVGVTALVILLPYLDRLRSISWKTHQPAVVAMHLLMAVWLGSVAYDALIYGDAPWYQMLSIASAGSWLIVSWETWRSGPPTYTESGPAPLAFRKSQ